MSRSYLRQSRMEGNRANSTPAPPFIKIGRSIRYLKEDPDKWLDEQPKYQHNENEKLPIELMKRIQRYDGKHYGDRRYCRQCFAVFH